MGLATLVDQWLGERNENSVYLHRICSACNLSFLQSAIFAVAAFTLDGVASRNRPFL